MQILLAEGAFKVNVGSKTLTFWQGAGEDIKVASGHLYPQPTTIRCAEFFRVFAGAGITFYGHLRRIKPGGAQDHEAQLKLCREYLERQASGAAANPG